MSLSGEEIELADPATPRRRKLQIRFRRLLGFLGTTGLMMLTICLFGAVALLIHFGFPLLVRLLSGEAN